MRILHANKLFSIHIYYYIFCIIWKGNTRRCTRNNDYVLYWISYAEDRIFRCITIFNGCTSFHLQQEHLQSFSCILKVRIREYQRFVSLYSEKPEKTYVSVLLALKVSASSRRSTLTDEGESYRICKRKIGVKITEQFLSCSVFCFKAASGSTWASVGVVHNDDGARTTTSIDSHYSSSFWISWLASPSFGSAIAPADGTLITVSVLCGHSASSVVKKRKSLW